MILSGKCFSPRKCSLYRNTIWWTEGAGREWTTDWVRSSHTRRVSDSTWYSLVLGIDCEEWKQNHMHRNWNPPTWAGHLTAIIVFPSADSRQSVTTAPCTFATRVVMKRWALQSGRKISVQPSRQLDSFCITDFIIRTSPFRVFHWCDSEFLVEFSLPMVLIHYLTFTAYRISHIPRYFLVCTTARLGLFFAIRIRSIGWSIVEIEYDFSKMFSMFQIWQKYLLFLILSPHLFANLSDSAYESKRYIISNLDGMIDRRRYQQILMRIRDGLEVENATEVRVHCAKEL